MALLNEEDLKSIISNALSLSSQEIDENSSSENLTEWDSLGQLSILSLLDEKTNGESSHIDGISELNSFKELKDNLISKGLLNEG